LRKRLEYQGRGVNTMLILKGATGERIEGRNRLWDRERTKQP